MVRPPTRAVAPAVARPSAVAGLVGLVLGASPSFAQDLSDTGSVLTADQVQVTPIVLRQPLVYPDSLRRSGIGGAVLVRAILDTLGRPESASVRVLTSPDSALDAPARASILGTVFSPARSGVDHHPVRVRLDLRVMFDPRSSRPLLPIYEDSVSDRPRLLERPSLEYPDWLRRAGIQGRVLVRAVIDTAGRVEPESIEIIDTPDPGFARPVLRFLGRVRFRPGRLAGRPVRVLVWIPFDFKFGRRTCDALVPSQGAFCEP
jgi:TonB family protein